MISRKLSAFMDANLNQRLEAMVINLMPSITSSSDMNMLYIAETDVTDEDGNPTQTKITSSDSIFISMIDEGGFINFESVKLAHIPGVFASDFETMEYYPSIENMKYFSTYYEGREVPFTGGYMDFAFSPFTVNTIELLNGDLIDIYGKGRIWVKEEQRGLKGYKSVPRVPEILSSGYFKILKLAIYSRYVANMGSTLSVNLFSPSMNIVQEKITNMIPIDSDLIALYINSNDSIYGEYGSIIDRKSNISVPALNISQGEESPLYGIGKMFTTQGDSKIDISHIKDSIRDEVTIHMNMIVREYSRRGTILFEIGYAKGSATTFTRTITLWLNEDGYIMYNTGFLDEATNTGIIYKKDINSSITFTISNEIYDEEDDDEYVTFIHYDGNQIWPEKAMLYEFERDYLWKALEAWKVYNEVCMSLPAPPPTTAGLDAREVCIQKLLHESGFETLDTLKKIYKLYEDRPRASSSDMDNRKINYLSDDQDNLYDSRIESIMIGQDAYGDTEDSYFYSNLEVSDILVTKGRMNRTQIENIHLLNTLKVAAVEL